MTYKEYFENTKKKFEGVDVSDITEHLAYQFNVTGEEAGSFYMEIKDGKLFLEPYDYLDRDALFTASAEVFNKIVDGKLDPIFAFTIKKLKVDGNLEKALKIKELISRRK